MIVHKERNVILLNKDIIFDLDISFEAKGLFAWFMMSAEYGDTSVEEIVAMFPDDEEVIIAAIEELILAGYIEFQENEEHEVVYQLNDTPGGSYDS